METAVTVVIDCLSMNHGVEMVAFVASKGAKNSLTSGGDIADADFNSLFEMTGAHGIVPLCTNWINCQLLPLTILHLILRSHQTVY